MNQTERMRKALAGEKLDRPPVITVCTSITVEVQEKSGIFLPEAHYDAVKMAALAEVVREDFRTENFKIPYDLTSESELLGADVEIGNVINPPQVRNKQKMNRYFLDKYADVEIAGRGRVAAISGAASILNEKYGGEIPILGGIAGPMSLLGMLFGFNDLFLTMHDDEDLFFDFMEFAVGIGVQHAKSLLASGAHHIQIGEAAASGDLIGPDMYRDLIMPWHRTLAEAIPAPVIMHICGNNNKNIDSFSGLPVAALSLDEKTNFAKLREATRGRMSLVGCVPVSLLLNGSEEDVFHSARRYIHLGADIISSACSLPPLSSSATVRGMSRAVLQN